MLTCFVLIFVGTVKTTGKRESKLNTMFHSCVCHKIVVVVFVDEVSFALSTATKFQSGQTKQSKECCMQYNVETNRLPVVSRGRLMRIALRT